MDPAASGTIHQLPACGLLEPASVASSDIKTLTITCFNRPDYLKRVLEHLLRNDLDGWTLHFGVEPCDRRDDVLQVISEMMSGDSNFEVHVNESRLGITRNPYTLLRRVFEKGSKINIYLEDDVIVSPDIIRIADWYSQLDLTGLACLNLMQGACGGIGHGSLDSPSAFNKTSQFNSLGMIFTDSQWQTYFEPNWFNRGEGWDWSIAHLIRGNPAIKTLQPVKARANHIGRERGTYCSPQFHDSVFSKLSINEHPGPFDYEVI